MINNKNNNHYFDRCGDAAAGAVHFSVNGLNKEQNQSCEELIICQGITYLGQICKVSIEFKIDEY